MIDAASARVRPARRSFASVGAALVDGWRRALRAPGVAGTLFALAGVTAYVLGPDPIARGIERASSGMGLAQWGLVASLWLFVAGGVFDRLARGEGVGPAAFLSACATHVLRFVRLGLFLLPLGALLLWALSRASTPAEPGLVAGLAPLTLLVLLILLNTVADYAAIRTVVEDRRSAIGSIAASVRFVRRRLWRVASLHLVNLIASVIILRLWTLAAGQATGGRFANLAGAIDLFLLTGTRFALLGSEVAFFQHELGRRPAKSPADPVWPDAP